MHNLEALQVGADSVEVTTGASAETTIPDNAAGSPARMVALTMEGTLGDAAVIKVGEAGDADVTNANGLLLYVAQAPVIIVTAGASVIITKAVVNTPTLHITPLENQ